MSNVIIKATNDQLSQMKAHYRSYLLNKQIPYTIFAAKKKTGRPSLLTHQEK